jgi:2-polyprenyl-6-methoxyphenol hydroxylase-like FAD-dependent oxidoreductase
VTGVDARRIPVVTGNRDSAAWGLVRQFLLEAALETPRLEFREGTTVTGVREEGGPDRASAAVEGAAGDLGGGPMPRGLGDLDRGPVSVDTTAGVLSADVVIGADGVYSVTRRFVDPARPYATYAGYLLWRGLVREADVPGGLGGRGRNLEVHGAPGAQLVVYGVPGADGRTDAGHRRVSFAWYDASRTELLRETGCLDGDRVVGTLTSDRLPAGLTGELSELAGRYWPAPWDRVISWGATHGEVFGALVAEYLPDHLVRDRVALVGDAAHVASPMTGAGFENALLDVAALARDLASVTAGDVPAALERYERERLARVRGLVSSGMAWGRSYLAGA